MIECELRPPGRIIQYRLSHLRESPQDNTPRVRPEHFHLLHNNLEDQRRFEKVPTVDTQCPQCEGVRFQVSAER